MNCRLQRLSRMSCVSGILLAAGLALAILCYPSSAIRSTAAEAPPASAPAAIAGNKVWNRNPTALPDNPAFKLRNQPFDVIARFGPVFVESAAGGNNLVDWPRPKAALVLTGFQSGYIEPCGCAGLENMKGGLSRLHSLINELTDDGWPLAKFDLGELVRRGGPQAVIKYQRAIDGLRTMGYQAIGFGPSDLQLPATDLLATLPGSGASHFVSANVGLLGMDNEYTAPFKVVEVGGMKIGVTSVTLPPDGKPLKNDDLAYLGPAEALEKILPKLQEKKCDKLVLLVNAPLKDATDLTPLKRATELARKFPQFDLVVTPSDADPPSRDLQAVPGTKGSIVELGHKGMFAGVVAFYDDAHTPLRYQRVSLDARFPDSPAMKQLMATYQDQLRDEGLERLGARPVAHQRAAKFVGSKACGDCHTKAFAVWEKTPHAHALETLEKLHPPRQFDPECLSCHVTGWDPKSYFPYASGYESLKKTPLLGGNGCENCHGPGSEHVAAENGDVQADDARKKVLRDQMRLTVAEAKENDCARCHDLDNSPTFNFDTFWPKIEHHGKD